jgi:hypothetical protein
MWPTGRYPRGTGYFGLRSVFPLVGRAFSLANLAKLTQISENPLGVFAA